MKRKMLTLEDRKNDAANTSTARLIEVVATVWAALDGQPFDKAAFEKIVDALEDAQMPVHHPEYYFGDEVEA